MDHLPKLIEDLALILFVGAIVLLVFKRIRQPMVLGYIVAGFFVGPHLSLIPSVADMENIHTLAEIGVIFLLFGLGLEMNLKKLLHVGGSSSITAIVEIAFITITGYTLGKLLGWSTMDSIFLGGMLASSSTTIIIKAFEDLGEKTKHYAQIVFGVLIVEDIVVIIILVLLPTIAVAQQVEGTELLLSILKLVFFLVVIVVAGLFLLPAFMKKARKFLNEETLLILSVGLCLGMVVLATHAGFSAELGAFIMGFLIAESVAAEKVEHVVKPVKDLFAAVFFVSIGMMIDPAMIIEYGWEVLAVTLLTIFGKLTSTTIGAVISGQPLNQSVKIGMSMSQIGEFAFIVVSLGLSLGVISEFLFPVAVGASAITTFTTPYMIKYSDNLSKFLERVLPGRWLAFLHNYSVSTRAIPTEKAWRKVFRSYASVIAINGIIIIALIILLTELLFLIGFFTNDLLGSFIGLVISFAVISPFLWGLMAKTPNDIAYRELWINKKYSKGPLMVIEITRVLIGLLLIALLVNRVFPTLIAILVLVPVSFVVLVIFSKQIRKFHERLELRFKENLSTYNGNKTKEKVTPKKSKQIIAGFELSPWDAHIIEMSVGSHADYVGKTLEQLAWREKYGINVAYIKRGDELIYVPTKVNKLFPNDEVGIIATDEQLKEFIPVFEAADKVNYVERGVDEIVIQTILVNDKNRLKGKSILDSGIKEKTNGLIIGIERNGKRILNPLSSTVFEWGDIVWLVGEREKIQKLTN